MRCILNERNIEKNSWHLLLPEVNYIIYTVQSSSTKYTPYKNFYGTDPTLIITASVDLEIPSNYHSVQDWVEDIASTEDLINRSVSENLEQSRRTMKKNYDVGKSDSGVEAGDFVLVRDEVRSPFCVLLRTGPNVKVRFDSGKEKVIHLNRCKRYSPAFATKSKSNCAGSLTTLDLESQSEEEQYFSDNDTNKVTPEVYSEHGTTENVVEPAGFKNDFRTSGRIRRMPQWLQDEQWPDDWSP